MANLSKEQKSELYSILQSWLSGIGEPFPELFKKNKIYKELWEMTTENINEGSIKGEPNLKQKMADKYSIDPKRKKRGRKRNIFRGTDIEKSIHPRETGKGGPKKKKRITEESEKCLIFMSENINKKSKEIYEALKDFAHRDKLLKLVNHMIITNLGGWKKLDEHKFIHITGQTALSENWNLLQNGKLSIKNGKYKQLDLDKLYSFKESLNG